MGSESPYPCTPRCMRFTTVLACLHRSRRRFKPWNDQLRAKNRRNRVNYRNNQEFHKTRAPTSTATTCQTCATLSVRGALRPLQSKRKRKTSSQSRSPPGGGHGDLNTSHRQSECSCADTECTTPLWTPGKSWDERRRDPRVNGADIYVARVTKSGLGDAKPCWRCLEWCRWAGVKRVFHWNGDEQRFEVVKVNSAERENYETRADSRLFAGLALQ